MPIEPFTIVLALVPLIGYLAILAVIRLWGRTLITTGGRDIAALAIAISGLVAVGPAELFFPSAAATVFGPVVWVALATFYSLCMSLIVLTSTPKLVVYGRTPEELYEPLLKAAQRIDSTATGDASLLQVALPNVGIRLRVDGQRGIDFAQVLAFEPTANSRFWSQLLGNIRDEVRPLSAPMPRRGLAMLLASAGLAALLIWQSFGNHALVVEGFREWLWR